MPLRTDIEAHKRKRRHRSWITSSDQCGEMMEYTSTTKRGYGQHGNMENVHSKNRKDRKRSRLDGNRKLKNNQWNSKKVMEKNEGTEDDLDTISEEHRDSSRDGGT